MHPTIPRARPAAPPTRGARRVGVGLLALAVVVAGLWTAGLLPDPTIDQTWAWHPNLTDLHIYLIAGHNWATRQSLYATEPYLAFLYPPLAAVPFAVLDALPFGLVAVGWTSLNALLVGWILHRVGLAWQRALLVAVPVILVVRPVHETVALGQVNLMLCALVLAATLPRRRRETRPATGVLVGLATAIKLTPGLFVAFALLRRRWAWALAAGGAFAATVLVGFAVAPHDSVVFWTRLAHGQTGLGDTAVYLFNQSLSGTLHRATGGAPGTAAIALALSALVAVAALLAAVRVDRSGDRLGAVCVVGFGALVASPVSWTNHFVWVVPLGVWCVAQAVRIGPAVRAGQGRRAGRIGALVLAAALVVWMSLCPFSVLPSADDVELTYGVGATLLSGMTVILALAYGIVMALLPAGSPPADQTGHEQGHPTDQRDAPGDDAER